MRYALAIDIGASSGRHIVGWFENGELRTEETYRFHNGVKEENGHLVWDTEHLLNEVKKGIDISKGKYDISTLSIDTWGVDYVLLKGDEEVYPVYAYRDSRTERVMDEVHSLIPFDKLYEHTGCQFQPFNTIYQLYDDKKQGRLEGVTDFLMIPEYLTYKLTGVKKKEFTNATTTGMINHETLRFDKEIINRLDLPYELFPELSQPGETLGYYEGIKVVLCATHDTGSAVEGIPMEGNELYISSGTWSLLGVKTDKPITDLDSMKANYSNEGGVGYNRYQKNIMGMWIVNELQRELCPDEKIGNIVLKAEESSYEGILDANDESLLAPASMKEAFDVLLGEKPENKYDYFRCAYRSLALSYKKAIEELEHNTGKTYSKLYIVGGGARNQFLNRLTEEYTGKQVIALPIEATAVGNLRIQLNKGEVMEKYAWKGIIAEGMKEEYVRRHNEIWPEMIEVLKEAGIVNYTIWNTGNEVFGYYECTKGADYAAKVQAESPVVDKWNEYMKGVLIMEMDPVTGAQPKLTKVFEMD